MLVIIGLIALNIITLLVFRATAEKVDGMKYALTQETLAIRKKQIDMCSRIDAMADIYGRLQEPLDKMDKNVSDMANMTEDTHLKMLYAYNEVSKIKAHGKHAKKCVVPAIVVSDANNDIDESKIGITGGIQKEEVTGNEQL